MRAKAVIIVTGTGPRPLGVPGEERLRGRGAYCAADTSGFEGRVVAVVGGGDAAVKEALYLAWYVSRVYIIHRRGL